jgi:hypothetical protein
MQIEIVRLIEPFSLYLIENINGNHVMQKCFEVVDLDLLKNIIRLIVDNVTHPPIQYRKLSLHAYGCRVIQKYLEKLHAEIVEKEELLTRGCNGQT